VARAQLDGRVREAERRVIEARQVIELQREELVAARKEREKLFRSNAPLQGRMKQLQKPTRTLENQHEEERDISPTPAEASMPRQQKVQGISSLTDDVSATAQPARPLATPATLRTEAPAGGRRSGQLIPSAPIRHISIKPGDTLWSIARKYGVSLTQLRSLNHLTDNQILVGQALRVPGDRVLSESAGKQADRIP
jgi:LysM repeat protein